MSDQSQPPIPGVQSESHRCLKECSVPGRSSPAEVAATLTHETRLPTFMSDAGPFLTCKLPSLDATYQAHFLQQSQILRHCIAGQLLPCAPPVLELESSCASPGHWRQAASGGLSQERPSFRGGSGELAFNRNTGTIRSDGPVDSKPHANAWTMFNSFITEEETVILDRSISVTFT